MTPVDPDPLGLNSESEFPMPALDALEEMARNPGGSVPDGTSNGYDALPNGGTYS